MIINERQKEILKMVIDSYVDLAEPISSEHLKRKYKFSFSSATIRAEMQKLTDMGYLYQLYTSAGRVPTDKGYRFFVNSLKEERILNQTTEREVREIRREIESHLSFLRLFSSLSSGLVLSYKEGVNKFNKEGLRVTFNDPEFSDVQRIKDFLLMIESIEESIEDFNLDNESAQIYIGEEAPIAGSGDFSIIMSKCIFTDNEDGLIAIVGPKRMPYHRNICLIEWVVKILKEENL